MPTDFEKLASQFLGNNSALKGKDNALKNLAETQDAQKVKQMLGNGESVKKAIESGDNAALKDIVTNILSTKEGARLADELAKMFK